MERGVWSIVSGDLKEPLKEEGKPEQIENFKIKAQVALSLLYLNIAPEYRKIIEIETSPIEAWGKLKKFYQPDTRATHMAIFTELVEARIKASENISLFGARLARLNERLRAIDPVFSSDYVTYQLLRYLPAQFDTVVQTILRWEKAEFNFVKVQETLVAEEARLNLRNRDENNELTPVQCNYSRNATTKVFYCFKCQQPGHFARNCVLNVKSQKSRENNQWKPRKEPRYTTRRVQTSRNVSPTWNVRKPTPSLTERRGRRRYRNGVKRQNYRSDTHFSNFASCSIGELNARSSWWIFDSAASHHLCKDKTCFSDLHLTEKQTLSVAVEGINCPIEGKGTVNLKFKNEVLKLSNVLYSPLLRHNLISGPRLDQERGVSFVGGGGRVKVYNRSNQIIFEAPIKNGMYVASPKVVREKCKRVTFAAPVKVENVLSKWHRRYAHIGISTLVRTSRHRGVRGLPTFSTKSLFKCEPCKVNKFRRVSFKSIENVRSKAPLGLICADVWGPHKVRGRAGERYFLSIIDDYSRKVSLYPIIEKSEVADLVISHINRVENFLNCRVKAFRSDNGTEFVNRKLDSYFTRKGIKRELTNIYTPEQNGICERFNQTVMNGARTILSESGLPENFWPDAMVYFVYTWNRACHTKHTRTPYELYSGNIPSVRHLMPFGTLAYAGVPRQHRKKLDARALRGYMIGYAISTKGYRIWIPESGRIIETVNVTFSENTFYKDAGSGAVLGPKLECENPRSKFHQKSNDEFFSLDEDLELAESEERTPPSETLVLPSSSTPKIVDWIRKPVTRGDGSRTDVYYFENGKTERLRSLNEVQKYCSRNNVKFRPELFDFRGSNKLKGVIYGHTEDDSSIVEESDDEIHSSLMGSD